MPHNFVNYYIAFRHSAIASKLLQLLLFASGKRAMRSLKERSFANRYLPALLAPAVVAGVMQATWPLFQYSPVLGYLLAVTFCAWYGGLGPGLLCFAVSFLTTDFFFIEPYFSFGVPKPPDVLKLLFFGVVGPFISVISELMHRERRRADINLDSTQRAEESLNLFRNLIDQSSDSIEVIEPTTLRFLDCNTTAHQYLGYTREEFLSLTVFDIDPIIDQAKLAQMAAKMEQSSFVVIESVHRRKDGSTFPVEINVQHARLEKDYRLAVVRDITERKLAEQAQRQSQLQYETLVQSIDGIVWEADPRTFAFTFVSKQAERILGYPLERWFEGPDFWPDHMHPDDRDWAVAFCMDFTERRVDHQFEYRMIAANGQVVWLSDIVTVHVGEDQSVLLRGVMLDITERKRAEAVLQESEARFRELSDAPFEPIILHDNGTILEVNQSFCRLYGYERAEVIGKSVLDLTVPESRDLLRNRVQSAGIAPFEGLALRKDGTIFKAEVAGKPIHYQGRVVRVAAIRDITEQKRHESRQAAQHAVTRVLAESATLAEATPKLLQVICESLRWKKGEFWRLSESANLLRCAATWHVPGLDATSFIEASSKTALAPGVGLPGRVWQSGEPAWIRDVMTDPRFEHAAVNAKAALRGAVAFPILLENQTLGVMLFFSRQASEVDADLLKIMSGIGSQIGQFAERKRAEEQLRESEERYRDLVEHSREFITTHDLDGRVLAANRAMAEALGYESSGVLEGRNIRDILAPEVRNEFEQYMASVREHGATSGVMLVATRSGERRLWEYYNSLRTEGVATPIVRGMARDITERREAEKALRVSERKYRDIFSLAPLGICQSLPDGRLITANKALATMLGYDSVDELLKLKLDTDVYFVAGQRQELISTYEPRGHAVDVEFQLKRKDGSPFWVQMDAHAVRGPSGATEYFEAFVRDITERKRAEEKLKRTSAQLRALSASLQSAREEEGTRIARELHDELGSSLTTLRWSLDEADGLLATATPEVDTATLRQKIATMTALAEGTLQTVRRISSELRPGILDNVGLVAAVEWEAQQFQARSGIVCYLKFAVAKPQLTSAQSTAIFRIFQQALTNVLLHASATRVDVSIMKEERELVLTIKDNGRGITDEEKSGTQSLGLVGMRERAYLIGGEVNIAGVENQGTVVAVRIPLGKALIRTAGSPKPRSP